MPRVRFIFALLGLVSLTLLAGCQRSQASGDAAEPRRLRVAFVPQVDMEERYTAAYRALEGYLSRALGIPVEVVSLESISTAMEAFRSGKLDLCNFSPWPYLIAERKVGVDAILVTARESGEPVSYHTVLATRPALALATPDDLKRRAGELIFSFEEVVSTSGHLVPRAFLHAQGITPERDFKQMLFSPDSTVSLLALKTGKLDVAAVSDTGLARAIAKRRLHEEDVRVIWKSPPVLANLVAIRRDLPDAFKRRVKEAMISLPEADPASWADVSRQYSQPVARYRAIEPAMLQPLRDAIRDVPGLQIAL